MKELESYFQEITDLRKPENLYKPIGYILQQGGKRIRPRLVYLATEIFGGDLAQAQFPAAAFEMLHNFTLIHDDIMDNAPIRRGKETVYKKWNGNIAILSGDALATMALQQLLKTPCPENVKLQMTDLFLQTSLEVCEGQQYDLDFETSNEVSIEDYLMMIRYKTAVMLSGCLKVGAILAGATLQEQQQIYDFGIKVGIAFQLTDDILDLYSDVQKFGKVKGGDIKENKKTFLYLLALQEANETQKATLNHYFSSTDFDFEEKLFAVQTIFDQLQVKEKTESYVEKYLSEALVIVNGLNISQEHKEKLQKIAHEFSRRSK